MLQFKFEQLEVRGRFYVPFPKLTSTQIRVVANRLRAIGFQTNETDPLHARKGDNSITVEARGLCYSNADPADALAPVIPDILAAEKAIVPFGRLREQYFLVKRAGAGATLKLRPRLESSSLWDELRASDSSGLTPDERAVYAPLLSGEVVGCRILTDYPTDDCTVTRIGRRRYFNSEAAGSEAAINLREIGVKRPRNSYLPRGSIIRVDGYLRQEGELRHVLDGLGDWCFFTTDPTSRKL